MKSEALILLFGGPAIGVVIFTLLIWGDHRRQEKAMREAAERDRAERRNGDAKGER